MSQAKQVYKNPQSGIPLITTISTDCKTPILEVKFCNLVNPYRYANSPTIPRYSVTCVIDPDEHVEFIKGIQAIETNEKVDSILKNDTVRAEGQQVTTGKIIIKFQTKDIIPVYFVTKNIEVLNSKELVKMDLEDELARGEKVQVVYDILRYTKKNTLKTEHGLSFKPTCIYYYPKGVE